MDLQSWWEQRMVIKASERPAVLFYSFADAKWYDVQPDRTWVPIPAPSWDHRTWRTPDEPLITVAQATDLTRWYAQ